MASTPSSPAPLTSDQAVRLQRLRIVFGHQSVGGNIISGLTRLQEAGEPVPLAVERTLDVEPARGGTLAHQWVGENGAPVTKLEAFSAALDGAARAANVGIVKFCYSDFGAGIDPDSLFTSYASRVEDWSRRHPHLRLVHVTAPTVRPEGVVARLFRTLRGRLTMRERAAKVARFNARIREAFATDGLVFDLAAWEVAGPDGQATGYRVGNTAVPFLHPAFTDDGEHLNSRGQVAVAREFIRFLADSVASKVSD